MQYSLTAMANLSYNNSGAVTSASSLAFTNNSCKCNLISGPSCTIIPTQISKSYSGSTAAYVVSLKRTAAGVYTDTIDVTINYTVTRAANSLSLNNDDPYIVEVTVSEGLPYNIEYLNE